MPRRAQPADAEPAAPSAEAQALCAAVQQRCGRGAWRAQLLHVEPTCHGYHLRATGQPDRMARLTRDRGLLEREAPALRALDGTGIALGQEGVLSLDPAGDVQAALYRARSSLHPVRTPDLAELAALFARLHDLPTMGLMRSFPVQDAPGVLGVLQRLVEHQRSYLAQRELDGLPQDMLALQLADLGRVVRRYAIAQEHHCQPRPRRALCHGAAGPHLLLRDREGLHLVGWEHARIGDAARDLALFTVAAALDEEPEAQLLERYLQARAHPDHRFIPRYFAHRALAVLERPVTRLLRMYRIKRQGEPVLESMVEVLQRESALAAEELARALTALNAFVGRGRPIAPRDVASMGRLITHEEFLLEGAAQILAIDGASYAGKTPTASLLATRLQAAYVNPAVLVRTALALVGADDAPRDLASLLPVLDAHDVQVEALPRAPYYRVLVDGEDLTEAARLPALYPTQRQLMQGQAAGDALRRWLAPLLRGRVVVDGEQLEAVLPAGVRHVVLTCDDAVREQRRRLHVDEGALDQPLAPAPAVPQGAIVVDSSRSAPAQTALGVIQALLPAPALEAILVPDFTGRRPLFER